MKLKEILFLSKWWVLGGFDWDEDAVAFEGIGDEATAKATASK